MFKKSLGCYRSLWANLRFMSKKFKGESLSPASRMETKVSLNFKELPSPIKPASDTKNYSVVQLENGLTATIISDISNLIELNEADEEESSSEYNSDTSISDASCDEDSRTIKIPPKTEKLAACSLTVQAGSFNDPDDIQGLAHFLEHMVFMGSKKYPKENEFDSFITKNGGSDNATTECEYTTFYFECQERHLEKALDIFSQLFKSPLMKKEAMTRERQAIESEFQIALPVDGFRKLQLLCSTVPDENPAHKFSWGNEITLKDNVSDDYLYDQVHKFRKEHYSGHKMKLAIQARLPEDLLKRYVCDHFSQIPSNDKPVVKYNVQNLTTSRFNRLYYIESVKNVFCLDLNWMLPSVIEHHKSKPLNYLSSVIGHEGKGSLLSFLRQKLWALSLQAGTSDEGLYSNSIYSIFTISVFLTELGRSHIDEVLLSIFSYLKIIVPDENLYKEMKIITDTDFKFREETDAVNNVENISENMTIYEPEEYISGPDIFYEYKPDLISKYLSLMKPDNVNIMISAKGTINHMKLDRTEPWFNTKYSCTDIPEQWIQGWKNVNKYPEFHLPQPNMYITTDFSLITNSKVPKYPEKLKSNDQMDIWYKGDDKFLLPVAALSINLIKNDLYTNSLTTVMTMVYIKALNEVLMERLYPASVASYEFDVHKNDYGLNLSIYGYNQKIKLVLTEIAQGMSEMNISEGLFDAVRETLLRGLYNENLNVNIVAKDLRMSVLVQDYYSALDKLKALKVLNYQTFIDFTADFFKNVHFQCLIQGNMTKQDAVSCCEGFLSNLECGPLPEDKFPDHIVLELPLNEHCLRINSFNSDDKNCVTTNYYQFSAGCIKDFVTLELILMLMEEPLFDKLRTQEQLGYDVSCSVKDTYGTIGFTITVNSPVDKYTVDHIQNRMADFLLKFQDYIKKMPEEEFKDAANTLIKAKKCVDNHLKEEFSRHWLEIKHLEYVFDRKEKEIKAISSLKKKHLVNLLARHLANDKVKKLTVQVVGHKVKEKDNILKELNYEFVHNTSEHQHNSFITDIHEFKKLLKPYPPHKIIK